VKPEPRPPLANLDERSRKCPAAEVLAAIAWDVKEKAPPDPKVLSAAEFLERLACE
jgi:hypothetical protein